MITGISGTNHDQGGNAPVATLRTRLPLHIEAFPHDSRPGREREDRGSPPCRGCAVQTQANATMTELNSQDSSALSPRGKLRRMRVLFWLVLLFLCILAPVILLLSNPNP